MYLSRLNVDVCVYRLLSQVALYNYERSRYDHVISSNKVVLYVGPSVKDFYW